MPIARHEINGNSCYVINGTLDASTVMDVRSEFELFVETESHTIIVDLCGVSFIDSSGIGALIFLYKRLKEQGRDLVLICGEGQPRRIFGLLRVDKTIPTFENINTYLLTLDHNPSLSAEV